MKEKKIDGNVQNEARDKVGGADARVAGSVEADARVAELEAKNAEMLADLQRTRADFENYRKQVESQRAVMVSAAQMATVYKVLGLLDDMDRAVSSYAELAPIEKTLAKTLSELKLMKIPIEVGQEFNPDLMEAVTAEGEEGKVAEVLRSGYMYNGEVLRPAMVKVQ